jgi:UMF1 family MFS transporter
MSNEMNAESRRVQPREIFGWAMFDFANSSFTTVMVTTFFSLYFAETIVGDPARGKELWGLTTSIAQFLVIVTAPLLGALADFSGAKKKFLLVTYLGCAVGTAALGLVGPGDIALAMVLFIIANVCFLSGENFISAFLPEICPPRLMGRISSLAWGLGYFGGIGAILVSVLILRATDNEGHRWVWIMVAAWFLIAGLPTFLFVRERHKHEAMPPGQTIATIGFHRLARTFREARRFRQLIHFLVTFMVYSCGVFAVIGFASLIARETLQLNETMLGVFIIVLNVVAALGAWGGGLVQDLIGSKPAIVMALIGWLIALGLVLGIELLPAADEPTQMTRVLFWAAGVIVGMSMGATFTASRAIVGLLSPEDRAAEFFGLWGVFGKLGGMIGLGSFGIVSSRFGSLAGLALLGVYFALGLASMLFVDVRAGQAAARTDD